jgi:hypothetical protein
MEPQQTPIGAAQVASTLRDATRRKALVKLGLAVGVAYMAPTVVHLDRAGIAMAASKCPPGQTLHDGTCSPSHPSDVRLKRDIVPIDRLANGIGLYRYRYLWSAQLYVGVMAQEVAGIVPDAVSRAPDGFLRVDYGRLGLSLLTWEEWQASGATRIAA